MREVVNAFKGIKEPMHVIMEEDEIYEESILGAPEDKSSDSDQYPTNDLSSSQNILDDSKSRSHSEILNSAISSSPTMNGDSIQGSPDVQAKSRLSVSLSEPEQKEGHKLFSILKPEIMRAFSLKSSAKADIFLDRVTFIARKLVSIWFGKEISLEQFNIFVDLLKEKAYLMSFPILLESFRRLGYFEIDRNGFQPFCELILACLSEVS
jgi:hypothetical protein